MNRILPIGTEIGFRRQKVWTDGRNGWTDAGQRQNYIPPTSSGGKRRKHQINVVYDSEFLEELPFPRIWFSSILKVLAKFNFVYPLHICLGKSILQKSISCPFYVPFNLIFLLFLAYIPYLSE